MLSFAAKKTLSSVAPVVPWLHHCS